MRASDQKSRTEGWFEVIAGKSIQAEGGAKVFAFVNKYDTKPNRRLYEVLKSQGLQMNQQIVFCQMATIRYATCSTISARNPNLCSIGSTSPCA